MHAFNRLWANKKAIAFGTVKALFVGAKILLKVTLSVFAVTVRILGILLIAPDRVDEERWRRQQLYPPSQPFRRPKRRRR